MKSLFIVFEGIDGSGTSTQVNLLKEYFTEKSVKATVTSEPSNGPIGNLIRQGMKQRIVFNNNKNYFDQQMAYLFAADRHDHLYNQNDGVFHNLKKGFHVISTRYYFSSFAYHCDNQEDLNFVRDLNKKFPDPDIVIYIDNPVKVSLGRINKRSVQDIYENEEKLTKVKNNYEAIFAEYNGNLLRIDGEKPPLEIHNQIKNHIEENFYE